MPAVDTMMDMVVRIERLITGVVTTEKEEENEIDRSNLKRIGPKVV